MKRVQYKFADRFTDTAGLEWYRFYVWYPDSLLLHEIDSVVVPVQYFWTGSWPEHLVWEDLI